MGADGVTYNVAAILSLQGDSDVDRRLERVGGSAKKASGAIAAIAQSSAGALASVGNFVGGALDRLGRFAAGAAMVGGGLAAGGALAAIREGVIGVNAKIEDSRIGFATLFTMFGAADGMQSGLAMSRELMSGIRADAAALPGETQDFVSMAQTMTAPLLNAGKGITDIRNLTRETVVAAAALGLNYDQAGREMAMLLEGRAGAHNVLGTRLGIHNDTTMAKGGDFNTGTVSDRLEHIHALLGKTAPALAEYQNSWSGLTSTLVDSTKLWLGDATTRLFARLKDELKGIGAWTDANHDKLWHWAAIVDDKLVRGFDYLVEQSKNLVSHWADIQRWASNAFEGAHSAIVRILPIAEKIGGFLFRELESPTKAIHDLIGLRVAAAAMGQAPNLLGAAMKGGGLLEGLFKGAPSVAAATTAKAAGSVGEVAGGLGKGALDAGMSAETKALLGIGGAAAGGGEAAGGVAAAGGAAVAAGPIFAALAVALVAVSAVAVAAADDVNHTASILKSDFGGTLTALSSVFDELTERGGLVRDTMGAIGAGIVTALDPAWKGLNATLEAGGSVLTAANQWWKDLNKGIEAANGQTYGAKEATSSLTDTMGSLMKVIVYGTPILGEMVLAFEALGGAADLMRDKSRNLYEAMTGDPMKVAHPTESNEFAFVNSSPGYGPEKPKVTPAATIDARGSKIEVNLNIKDNDPDRIIQRTADALGRAIVRSTMSPSGPVSSNFGG